MNTTTNNTQDTATAPPAAQAAAQPPATSTALAKSAITTEDFKMALEPDNHGQVWKLAEMIARSGMFKTKGPEDAMVKIMTGRALGLPMFAALKGLYTIDGGVGIEAKLKVAMVLQRNDCEYFRCTERTAQRCTWTCKRRGQPEQSLTFTIEEAIAAGLVDRGKDEKAKSMNNWNRFPADMLVARASARLADLIWPEASLGLPTREDLEDARAIVTTGEDVTDAPPAQAAPLRDFAAECAALTMRVTTTKPEERKALREDIARFTKEAPAEYGEAVKAAYNEALAQWKAAGTAPATT